MTIDSTGNQPNPHENQRLGYTELCATYHRLKNFRATLLGLLPLATGAGVFATLKETPPAAPIISLFGFLFTSGLLIYEIHGSLLVKRLICIGAKAEAELEIEWGQFTNRPKGIGGDTGALIAAIAIYGAALILWSCLAFIYNGSLERFCHRSA